MDSDTEVRLRARGLVAALALVILGTVSPSLAQDQSPVPTSAPVIHGWPGARHNPAGQYSWSVSPGTGAWMHNVPEGWPEVGWIEIMIRTLPDPAYDLSSYDIQDPRVDLERSYTEVPERVADARMQAWLMEVDGTKVVVVVKSFPNTPAELVAEAEAVVRSIHVEPAGTGPGRRVVFTLPAGWDSG